MTPLRGFWHPFLTEKVHAKTAVALGLLFFTATYWTFIAEIFRPFPSTGISDWRTFTFQVESIRRIISEFGQFPWWNPYSSGGAPLYAGSAASSGTLSITTPLTLIFGTLIGVKISFLVHAAFGFWGMYRLAGIFSESAPTKVLAAILFIMNGGILLHLAVGHQFQDYYYFPSIIYFFWRALDAALPRPRLKYSLIAGALYGLQLNCHLHYGFVYTAVTIGLVFLFHPTAPYRARKGYEVLVGMVLVFLALSAFKLSLALEVTHDFARIERIDTPFGLNGLMSALMWRGQNVFLTVPFDPTGRELGWWEYGLYVGIVPVFLFCLSLSSKLRSFHWITFIFLLLFVFPGKYSLYWWLNTYVPVWQSMRVSPRIRIWMIPFFALGVELGARMWSEKIRANRPKLSLALPWLVLIVVGADLTMSGRKIMRDAFVRKDALPSEEWLAEGNTKPYPITYRVRPACKVDCDPNLFFVANRNFAAVPGDEPSFSRYLWQQNLGGPIRGFNETGYTGEFSVSGKEVQPRSWTPNRIEFEKISGPLRLNINPSSYWKINGSAPSPDLSVAQIDREFIVLPDAEGRVVLEIHPKGFSKALLATFFFVVLLFSFVGWFIFYRCVR